MKTILQVKSLSGWLYMMAISFLTLSFTGCNQEEEIETNSISDVSSAIGDQIDIENSGFESKFNGWEDTDPSAISGDSHSGSRSVKITGSSGKVEQTLSITTNTDYILTAYVLDKGTIGVTAGSIDLSDGGDFDDWTQVSVSFNSGSNTSIKIYAKYNGGTGRVDDFALVETGTETTPEEQDPDTGSDGKLDVSSVSASDDDSNVPENTIDGSLSTRWSAKGDGQYITYDLGSSMIVSSLDIAWFKGDQRSSDFEISVGASTSSLVKVYEGFSSGNSTDLESYDFSEVAGRYVRITGFGNSSNNGWNSITETEIYGQENPNQEEEEEEENDDNSDIETGNAQVPSDLMDNCDQWKITYPDGEEDKTLCEEANNEYFFVSDDRNAIVFRAPVRSNNGTTPNSDNIRSELRERTLDGKVDEYWSTDNTHVVYSKQAITHLPINKDELVATQIHGDKSAGIDDAMVLRLEGSHLFLAFNYGGGNDLRSPVTITNNYVLGTVHEVIFEVIDGKHYCYYSEDGNLNNAYNNGNASSYLVRDGGNDYVMDLDYTDAYFKIGNYTQSNPDEEDDDTDDPDNYGEVYVYDFWVTHIPLL